jgi:hypothetical protein
MYPPILIPSHSTYNHIDLRKKNLTHPSQQQPKNSPNPKNSPPHNPKLGREAIATPIPTKNKKAKTKTDYKITKTPTPYKKDYR